MISTSGNITYTASLTLSTATRGNKKAGIAFDTFLDILTERGEP